MASGRSKHSDNKHPTITRAEGNDPQKANGHGHDIDAQSSRAAPTLGPVSPGFTQRSLRTTLRKGQAGGGVETFSGPSHCTQDARLEPGQDEKKGALGQGPSANDLLQQAQSKTHLLSGAQ